MSGIFRRISLRVPTILVALTMTAGIVCLLDGSLVAQEASQQVAAAVPPDSAPPSDKGSMHWVAFVVPILGLLGLAFTFWTIGQADRHRQARPVSRMKS